MEPTELKRPTSRKRGPKKRISKRKIISKGRKRLRLRGRKIPRRAPGTSSFSQEELLSRF
jgi:hypothetical protein